VRVREPDEIGQPVIAKEACKLRARRTPRSIGVPCALRHRPAARAQRVREHALARRRPAAASLGKERKERRRDRALRGPDARGGRTEPAGVRHQRPPRGAPPPPPPPPMPPPPGQLP